VFLADEFYRIHYNLEKRWQEGSVGNYYISKIKHIIYILLFLISFNGLAQFSDEEQHKIDSLNSIIENQTSNKIDLADSYVKLSEIIYVSNFDTLKSLGEKAILIVDDKLSSSNDNEVFQLKQTKANALSNIGFVYQMKGDNKTALEYYSNSLLVLEKIKDYKTMATIYNNIGSLYHNTGETKKAFKFYNKSLKMELKTKDFKAIANSYNNIGMLYYQQGEIEMALNSFQKSLKINNQIQDKYGMSMAYSNLGLIYDNRGIIQKALEYYHKSLKLREEIGFYQGVANSYYNLGDLYFNQGDVQTAMKYTLKSLKLRRKIEDKEGEGFSLNNLGRFYTTQGNLDEGLDYFMQALKIREQTNNKYALAISLNNIGSIFQKKAGKIKNERDSLFELANSYYLRGLEIRNQIADKQGITSSLTHLGMLALEKGDKENALNYGLEAMDVAQELDFIQEIQISALLLSNIYESKKQHVKALKYYKLHIQMRDSINNEETQKAAIRQQTQYEFEKEQIRKENEAKEQARLEAEATSRRNNLQYSLIFLGILVLFGIVLSLGFIKVSPNIAEGLIFFAFLILFEFVLVFTEPYLEQYTNGEPMYNLFANSVLALVIFPLHAILEKLLKKRIVKS
jgi:tetratricopeptide (TPR) repeat protein